MPSRPVKIVMSLEAKESYDMIKSRTLDDKRNGITNSDNIRLLNSIERAFDRLKFNPVCGIHVPKRNIPKGLLRKWETNRLWKMNLTNYWRLIYSLKTNVVEIITVVLSISDHKKYNKLFGYKK